MLARLLTDKADTAFQIWFLLGYAFNFAAAYYALRRMKGSVLASSIGAAIFSFALPTTAHALHVQLHYRFGLPLAIVFFVEFLNTKSWRLLVVAGVWLVWQFYAGIYMGFFTLFLLATMGMTYVGLALVRRDTSKGQVFRGFVVSWMTRSRQQKAMIFSGLGVLLVLLLILFYPYLQVTHLYGAKRSWAEIAPMLPRPQSYFLADASVLWSTNNAQIFTDIPMRHEHQMFMGLLPLALAVIGFWVGLRRKLDATFSLMSGMLGVAIVLTLYVGGLSFWYLLHKFPLVSAIRAMTRIDQALLFPVAYLAAVAVDHFRTKFAWGGGAVIVLILPLLVLESGMTSMGTSLKDLWRQRLNTLELTVPRDLPADAILFVAQRSGPFYADELDAMWIAQARGLKTMNGYSGNTPPGSGYELNFGRDCSVIPRRVLSYLTFSGQSGNIDAYKALMSRIVPIGFLGCDPVWSEFAPSLSTVDRAYTAEEFRKLSLSPAVTPISEKNANLEFVIQNSGDLPFSAQSSVGKPIRISWRYLDVAGHPLSSWDTRRDLPFDIPANSELKVLFSLDPSKSADAAAVQVSLVQETVFWGHDIGVSMMTIPLK